MFNPVIERSKKSPRAKFLITAAGVAAEIVAAGCSPSKKSPDVRPPNSGNVQEAPLGDWDQAVTDYQRNPSVRQKIEEEWLNRRDYFAFQVTAEKAVTLLPLDPNLPPPTPGRNSRIVYAIIAPDREAVPFPPESQITSARLPAKLDSDGRIDEKFNDYFSPFIIRNVTLAVVNPEWALNPENPQSSQSPVACLETPIPVRKDALLEEIKISFAKRGINLTSRLLKPLRITMMNARIEPFNGDLYLREPYPTAHNSVPPNRNHT